MFVYLRNSKLAVPSYEKCLKDYQKTRQYSTQIQRARSRRPFAKSALGLLSSRISQPSHEFQDQAGEALSKLVAKLDGKSVYEWLREESGNQKINMEKFTEMLTSLGVNEVDLNQLRQVAGFDNDQDHLSVDQITQRISQQKVI